jgi:hypothetical protein
MLVVFRSGSAIPLRNTTDFTEMAADFSRSRPSARRWFYSCLSAAF